MTCSKIVCSWAIGALLGACQPAWANPEPQPPARAPDDQSPDQGKDRPGDDGKAPKGKPDEGKAPKDEAKKGKGEEGKPPKGDAGGGKAGAGESPGNAPKEGKKPKAEPDPGRDEGHEGDDGADEPAEPQPLEPPVVEHTEPKFIGDGEVPQVGDYLAKTLKSVAQCVADHGGLSADEGDLEVQFLVRARGRAEGVEVLSRKSVSAEAARCVRLSLKNGRVGTPTADPVGVTFHYRLKRAR